MMRLLLVYVSLLSSVSKASSTSAPPSQLRLTFSPSEDSLVIAWTTFGLPAGSSIVEFGSTISLGQSNQGTSMPFDNYDCPGLNATRTSHSAEFSIPAGSSAYYRVSGDGGVSFSEIYLATNPFRNYPQVVSLWGDAGIECGGVLPKQPGFAGGQCTNVYQVSNDSSVGKHFWTLHFGDSAYNMDDRCGQKGDLFLDAAAGYAAHRPHIYGNGNHESSSPLKTYTEYTNRLAYGQNDLTYASGSDNNRWLSWEVGPTAFISVDADGWIYPLCYDIMPSQYAWLQTAFANVNRTRTPWLVFITHRALYCTKTTDPECNSESEAIRNGQLGLNFAVEPLLLKYRADFVFSGHTHHMEVTYPVKKGQQASDNFINPRAPIHIQSGIAGTGPGDEFAVPQQPWEYFRDTIYIPGYGRLTFFNDTNARYEQLFNDNGTSFFSIDVVTDHANVPW
jgi:hypothetical protein